MMNQEKINDYLICSGSVCEAPFLGDTLVADIDKDGSYELLSVCGWGSGIYRIEIKAYKFGNPLYVDSKNKILYPAYYNCYVPKAGYAELMLKKISGSGVRLFGAVREKGRLVPKTDYGTLKIDGSRLYTDAPDFPFKEWSISTVN